MSKLGQAEGYKSFRPHGFPCWSPDGKAVVTVVLKQKVVTSAAGVISEELGVELVFASLEKGVEQRLDLKEMGLVFVKCIDWR